jgi:hypothetical protein
MVKSGKVKTQVKALQDHELTELFQQMIDPNKADKEVIFPKYEKLSAKITMIARYLSTFATGPVANTFSDVDFETINKKGNEILTNVKSFTCTMDNINEHWAAFKDCMSIKESIMLQSYLSEYKQYINDKDNLSDHWIKKMSMGTKVFKFSNLDLYLLWNDTRMTEDLKKYILTVFNGLYRASLEVYQINTSPDVDIERFSEVLTEAIAKVQQVPELNRCKTAFKKIRESVDLLQENFNGYFKDFVQSQNPSTIIESFIVDVSSKQKSSPQLTREFRQIIRYYQKMSNQSNIKDPNIKKLFSALDNRMTVLENSHKNKNNTDSVDNDNLNCKNDKNDNDQ